MKPITPQQIASLSTAQQYFHDCYLLSSLGILSRSKKGQKILQNNITTNGKDFNIKFKNVNGKAEDYFISESEINNLEYIDSKPIFSNPSIPIVKSVELAMNKLIKKHPFQKPLICRALETQERFEYNKPSNFLKLFTGITPETINESNLSMSLLDKISKAIDTLKKIANDKDSTFIVGTGISFDGLPSWHCYGITKVDIQNNKFYVFDHRLNKELEFPIISGLLKFKFLTGFWSKDLK